MKLSATTLTGFEQILAQELRQLGAKNIKTGKRIVEFEGDQLLMYRANLEVRSAIRILKKISTFRVRHESALYQRIQEIDWTEYLDLKGTLAIDGVTHSKFFTHSKYLALKTKDAIVDQFRDKFGERPNVDVEDPDLRIHVHIKDDFCTVSLDSSGHSLHYRGYRAETLEAPINEVLAAGMILLSEWDRKSNFIDPMCGAGTLLIEAGFYARNIPANWVREDFGFMYWNDYDANLWKQIREDAEANFQEFKYKILGFDKSFQAIRIAERNAERAGLEDLIEVQRKPFEKLVPPAEPGILIFNPPYDQRLQEVNMEAFYEMIGDQLKQQFAGYTAWLISSNFDAIKKIGLRPSKKIALMNGALDCKFLKFEMYDGSRRVVKD